MNIKILLLSAVFVAVSGDAIEPVLREAFYEDVDHLALSLDPRDYIVAFRNGQSNPYHDADMNMITELTIFYNPEAVGNKSVTLSLTCSEQRDYKVKFEIFRNGAYLRDDQEPYNPEIPEFNYAWMESKVMRFYICFLGRMCSKNAVSVKHPLTHFKIESDDSHALMRVFIKGFFFNVKNSISYSDDIKDYFNPDSTFKETWMTVSHKFLAESVCSVWFFPTDSITLKMNPYTMPGSKPREDITLKTPHIIVQIRTLSLYFAILIILHDIQTKERIGYELFIADKLPTDPVKIQVTHSLDEEWFSLLCKDEK